MQFINCLVNTPDDLALREEVRTDFLRLGIRKVIETLKKTEKHDPSFQNLNAQFQNFLDDMEVDHDEMKSRVGLGSIDLEYVFKFFLYLLFFILLFFFFPFRNVVDVITALQANVKSMSYLQKPFLGIMKALLALPVDADLGLRCFCFAEHLLQQVSYQKDNIAVGAGMILCFFPISIFLFYWFFFFF
jgi:hypothetical protein